MILKQGDDDKLEKSIRPDKSSTETQNGPIVNNLAIKVVIYDIMSFSEVFLSSYWGT